LILLFLELPILLICISCQYILSMNFNSCQYYNTPLVCSPQCAAAVWLESLLPAPRRQRLPLHHKVPQHPDPLYLHFHSISFLHRPHARRRACGNHITRLKGHDAAYELHQFQHIENQVVSVRLLHHLSIDARLNIRVGGIDPGDPGAEGGKGIEAPGARPLRSQGIPSRSFIALTSACICLAYPG